MSELQKQASEQATGCQENPTGIGQFYDNKGNALTPKQARQAFRDGQIIEVPNAGAGSYYKILESLGYKTIEDVERGSSAGDWTLAVKTRDGWRAVYQENRYPFHGFRYSLQTGNPAFHSFKKFCDFICCS